MPRWISKNIKWLSLVVTAVFILGYGLVLVRPVPVHFLRFLTALPLVLSVWALGRRAGELVSAIACTCVTAITLVDQLAVHHLGLTVDLALTDTIAAGLIFAVPSLFGRLRESMSSLQQAKASLTSQSAYREAIIRALPDLLFELDRDGRYLGFGGRNEELLYRSMQELQCRTVTEALPADAARIVMETLGEVSTSGFSLGSTYQLALPQGARIFEPSVSAIGDPHDPCCRFLLLARDVTERVEAENRIRESEELYRTVVENAPLGYFRSSLSGEILAVNAKHAEIFGYSSPQELITSVNSAGGVSVLFERPERRQELIATALADKSWKRFENKYRKRDGSIIIALLYLHSRATVDGHVELEGFLEDLTELSRAREALESSNAHFAAVMNAFPDIYFELDRDGRFLDARGRLEMLRYGAWNEMIGRTVAEVLPEAAAKIITEALEQVTSTGQAETLSYSISTPSGTSYRETSFALVGDPSSSESSVVALVRDVTERVSLQDQLLQSQKLEAVGRLAGGIAHDFNNILQVILGFCDLLSDHSETQEKALNDVAVIRDAASRAASLTAQLLTFSRNEAQNLKALDVCAVAQVMSPMLQRALGEDIALQVACPSTPLWIEADEGQFLQILMNLAVNARDAMPNGGSLRIEIDEASASRLRNIAAVSGDHVRISVADRGTGMTEEVMDHIFEPFYTTKEVGRGTGLGLSIVYSIMKQFHGHISVQSELEKGTRFDLYFPRVSHTLSSETHALTPTSDSRGSETVLVIEDEAPVRSLVQRVLKSKGYAVLVASNGKEGLATLGRQKGRIDLLLTDMVMPDMKGDAVAAEFKRRNPSAPVIIMSGYSPHAPALGKENPAAFFLPKPFRIDELLSCIRKALDKE